MYYMIFNELFEKDGKYYYRKYDNYLPIESATIYNVTNEKLNEYLKDNYKLYTIDNNLVLVKNIYKKSI